MVGQLNYDVWRGIIGFLVDDMRIKRDFPNTPDVSTSVAHIHTCMQGYRLLSCRNYRVVVIELAWLPQLND